MWGQKQRSGGARQLSGLFFDDTQIAVATIQDGRRLSTSTIPKDPGDEGLGRLGSTVGAGAHHSSRLTSVLPHGAYQLLLVDLPNVPASEMKEAVRWQIKDLLDFPVDEAVIELFDIPEQSNAGNKPTAYAVASRRGTLQQHVDRIHAAGLSLDAIDIPELCVRNIAALLPQDADGVALLHFTADRGMLTVTRRGLLYFIRHFEIGSRALSDIVDGAPADSDRASAVVLEVQRSLDYYESHYDRRPVTDLVLAAVADLGRLPELLHEQFGLNVSRLDLAEHFELKDEIAEEYHGACLLAIGAALRAESSVN